MSNDLAVAIAEIKARLDALEKNQPSEDSEVAMQYGHVKVGSIETEVKGDLDAQAEIANRSQHKIHYRALTSGEVPLLDDLPVGTILPYIPVKGGFKFSDRWQIALGQKIRDSESPIDGETVPDLNGSALHAVYIAGTFIAGQFKNYFGSNIGAQGGEHTHAATAGRPTEFNNCDSGNDAQPGGHNHAHPISVAQSPAHNHGDNRPFTYGVVYLIKVK